MAYALENQGVLTTVFERFEKYRLPRIIQIKDMVDKGGRLNKSDIQFLGEVLSNTRQYSHFVSNHSEYQRLFSHVTNLYNEITTKALDNERSITPKIPASN